MILRGAQLCGIPYFFKNSTTLAQNLTPLQKNEDLENGDLIWFLGHVIIISDVKNNLVVEARGYEHSYGRVHEASLKTQFNNISTYEDLKKAYLEHIPLERLNLQGIVAKEIPTFKLLKLKSVWPQAKDNIHSR